jgi:hypothetical protein
VFSLYAELKHPVRPAVTTSTAQLVATFSDGCWEFSPSLLELVVGILLLGKTKSVNLLGVTPTSVCKPLASRDRVVTGRFLSPCGTRHEDEGTC